MAEARADGAPIRRAATTVGVGVACSLLLAATAAAAKDTGKETRRAACAAALTAYRDAQEHEKARRWLEARDLYASCAAASACGGLSPRCQARAERLASSMPSVVPIVTDDRGNPRVDVQVRCDGRLLTSKLDGTGLPVDSGLHEFAFSTEQGVFATQKVLVVESQRNRVINVTMGPDPGASTASNGPPTPAPAAPIPAAAPEGASPADGGRDPDARGGTRWAPPRSPWPYVLGGAGVAALTGGALLTVWGNRDNDALRRTCSPLCQPSSLDHVRALYLAADIAYGAGAAALAVTTFLFATSRKRESAEEPAARPVAAGVAPAPGGAFAAVSGTF